jgi:hypothetical protein
MWAWQSDKNHLDNIAKKEKKIAKWTWQFGKMDLRKKQVKSIRQKYPRKIHSYHTQANISFWWRHPHQWGHILEFKKIV